MSAENTTYVHTYRRLQDKLLERYELKATSRFIHLAKLDSNIHLLEAGSGDPLIFLHGGAGIAAEHIPVAAHLAGRYHVILPDRPGHGLSDEYDYRGLDLRRANVEFVEALLDELGIQRATLIGNSFGGLMAVCFALAHPERVSRLIVLSFFPGLVRELPLMMRLAVMPVLGALQPVREDAGNHQTVCD